MQLCFVEFPATENDRRLQAGGHLIIEMEPLKVSVPK